MRSNTASSLAGVRTSSGMRIAASSLTRERLDEFLGLFVEIGDRELRAERAKCLGAAPGDRMLVGDADDQAALAFEQRRLGERDHGVAS